MFVLLDGDHCQRRRAMLHRVLGPHFLGGPWIPGIPNLVLIALLALAVWYFLRHRDKVSEQAPNAQASVEDAKERENRDLRAEVARLRRENELLTRLLEKESSR